MLKGELSYYVPGIFLPLSNAVCLSPYRHAAEEGRRGNTNSRGSSLQGGRMQRQDGF